MKFIPIVGKLELEHRDKDGNSIGRAWKFPSHKKTPEDFKNIESYIAHLLFAMVIVVVSFFADQENTSSLEISKALFDLGTNALKLANKFDAKYRKENGS